MIEYIKEYGVTSIDYEYILRNCKKDIIELIAISEDSVRELLDYYNSIGITKNIAKLILYRPDLILIPKESIEESISKIDIELLKIIINDSVEDLILLGI